ncbi:MAG: serine hydrolase domain-containing protein [Bacteroidota bacterium]
MKKINLFLCFLLLHNIVISQNKTDYFSIIENYKSKIEQVIKSGKVKGMAIALIDGNKIVWSENFGYSDYENKIKADSNTIYGIGSVSKLFTGTAIMQLHEKGKLDIDKPISVYSPEFKIKKRHNPETKITARMLLCHHSGLPSDITTGVFSQKPKPFQSIVELVKKEYAPYTPDYIYSYSNIGYSLLGIIIENVSGEPYENYIKSNIFDPLQMHSACFTSDKSIKFSKGYDEKGNLREEYGIRPVPAGAIKSNIRDMAKFAMSFLPEYNGTTILKQETIKEMLKRQNNNSPLDLNKKYGLTWHYERINSAGQIYYHTGGTLNHRSLLAIAPESNLAAVILSNSVSSGRFHGITMNLLDTCAILKGRDTFKSNYKVSEPEPVTLSNNELEVYKGFYANSMFVIKIDSEQNKLTTKIQGNQYILNPLKDGSFLPQIVLPKNKLHTLNDNRLEFKNIENNNILIFHTLSKNKKQILAIKFQPKEINDLWKSRVGTYQLAEINDSDFPMLAAFELAIDNGIMVLKITEEYEGALMWNPALLIKDDNVAFPMGIGRHRGSTLLFESDKGKEILWYSGYKLKRVEN